VVPADTLIQGAAATTTASKNVFIFDIPPWLERSYGTGPAIRKPERPPLSLIGAIAARALAGAEVAASELRSCPSFRFQFRQKGMPRRHLPSRFI